VSEKRVGLVAVSSRCAPEDAAGLASVADPCQFCSAGRCASVRNLPSR
jgi:hypothetical protein